MNPWLIVFLIAAAAAAVVAAIAYICFRMAFYAPPKSCPDSEAIILPEGKVYEPHYPAMTEWIRETRAMVREEVFITSFDGLRLRGCFYEFAPGAPIELMVHGYRGTAERDLCGGVQRCFSIGRSCLLIDQRAAGGSEGSVITFGINERRDCLMWVDFLVRRFGPEVPIILTGISMGASTVMMAAGEPLPPSVVGVIADCGFSSAREIICKVITQLKLPCRPVYPFVKLGARLFGHFDLEETSALEAMGRCRIPVFFIHGEADDFVPCSMSRACYAACAAPKHLFTVPGAGHGLGYVQDPQGYVRQLAAFSRANGIPIDPQAK